MARKPLMLKDYLELDPSSDSFHEAPPPPPPENRVTVRCLLDTELRGGADGSQRPSLPRRSKGALTRLSAVIGAIRILPSPSADSPSVASSGWRLTSTFSKKLRLGFWKRSGHQGREGKELKDNVRLRSLGEEVVGWSSFYPSPVVSSCSSSFDGGDSIGSDFELSSVMFENGEHESLPMSPRPDLSPTPSPQKEMFKSVDENSREPKENSAKAMNCPSEVEKEQQFSPVAVMDFPYQDDEDDEEVELYIDRTKNELLQKIQRSESLPDVHVTVEEEDAGFEDEGERRRRSAFTLLRRLTAVESFPACDENLLFDFFMEESQCLRGTKSGSAGDEEMLRAASGWIHGGGGAQKHYRAVVLGEMERWGGWRRCEEEEEMAAVVMAGGLVALLVEELVDDLV